MKFKTRVYIDNTETPELLWIDKGDGSTTVVVDLISHSVIESAYSGEELAEAAENPVRGLVELKPSQEV